MEIIRLKTVDSTNTYAKTLLKDNKIRETICIITENQTSGRGLHKNIWESEINKNLTFSLICFPEFLAASKQFQLNKAVSLSVYDLIKKIIPLADASIKWPNDIFIGTKKIGGILVENSVIANKLNWVIIGIGINVNQLNFPDNLPYAASLIHFSKSEFDLNTLLDQYIKLFEKRYDQIITNKHQNINKDYLKALFRFGIPNEFIYRTKKITATITGVNKFGWLQLKTNDNLFLECEMKEIAFVL